MRKDLFQARNHARTVQQIARCGIASTGKHNLAVDIVYQNGNVNAVRHVARILRSSVATSDDDGWRRGCMYCCE